MLRRRWSGCIFTSAESLAIRRKKTCFWLLLRVRAKHQESSNDDSSFSRRRSSKVAQFHLSSSCSNHDPTWCIPITVVSVLIDTINIRGTGYCGEQSARRFFSTREHLVDSRLRNRASAARQGTKGRSVMSTAYPGYPGAEYQGIIPGVKTGYGSTRVPGYPGTRGYRGP
eukprot:90280-Rhodomonas_salina.1